MILSAISKDIFNIQTFSQAAIVDSGFSQIPANATLHTQNTFIRRHGSQVLKILSFHNQIHIHLSTILSDTKDPLLTALQALPDNLPLLNLSLVWNDHNKRIYDLLFHKFQYIICAYKENTYPTLYKEAYPDNLITVSNNPYHKADYVIPLDKVFALSGNSAVTPVISNLISHTPNFHNMKSNPIRIEDMFTLPINQHIQQDDIHINIPCPNCGYVNKASNKSCDICNYIFKI